MDVLSHPCDGEPSCHHYPSGGLALGGLALVVAMALDDAWLARDGVPAGPATASVVPGVALAPNRAVLSLGGDF